MNRQKRMLYFLNSCAIATIGVFYFLTNISELSLLEECDYITIEGGVKAIVTHGPCYAYGDIWFTFLFLIAGVLGVLGGYYSLCEMIEEEGERKK